MVQTFYLIKWLSVPIKGEKIINESKLNKIMKLNYKITQCWMVRLEKKKLNQSNIEGENQKKYKFKKFKKER